VQVEAVVESLRTALRKDVGSVSAGVSVCRVVQRNLHQTADDLQQHVGRMKSAVQSAVDALRQRVEHDEDKMLACLTGMRENASARFHRDRREVDAETQRRIITNNPINLFF